MQHFASARRALLTVGAIGMGSLMLGARGGCGGSYSSTDPAPRVAGEWAVAYDDAMEIDVRIGGAVYHQSLPASGGVFTIDHDGMPFEFSIDCARREVVCPSEVWPAMVSIDQRDETYQHRMWVAIPTQSCSGSLVAPPATECGEGTLNPDCEPVCDGEIVTSTADAFGLISEDGDRFDLLLGGGVASNGINCALLHVSSAHATLDNVGDPDANDWESVAMSDGEIRTAVGGGCLWAGDPDMDGELEALVLGASVEIATGFTASRSE